MGRGLGLDLRAFRIVHGPRMDLRATVPLTERGVLAAVFVFLFSVCATNPHATADARHLASSNPFPRALTRHSSVPFQPIPIDSE